MNHHSKTRNNVRLLIYKPRQQSRDTGNIGIKVGPKYENNCSRSCPSSKRQALLVLHDWLFIWNDWDRHTLTDMLSASCFASAKYDSEKEKKENEKKKKSKRRTTTNTSSNQQHGWMETRCNDLQNSVFNSGVALATRFVSDYEVNCSMFKDWYLVNRAMLTVFMEGKASFTARYGRHWIDYYISARSSRFIERLEERLNHLDLDLDLDLDLA